MILATGFERADPIASLVIAALLLYAVLRSAQGIGAGVHGGGARRASTPTRSAARSPRSPGVVEVHDLHVWEVTSGFPALSAHVVVRAGDDCHERAPRAPAGCCRALRHRPHDAPGRPRGGRPAAAADRAAAARQARVDSAAMKADQARTRPRVPRGIVGGAEISQATAGAHNIYMGRFRVPAGARSRPHYHEGCESALTCCPAACGSVGRPPRAAARGGRPATCSTCRRGSPTWSRTCRTPSPPSTSSRGTRRTRTRSSCRGRRTRVTRRRAAVHRRRRAAISGAAWLPDGAPRAVVVHRPWRRRAQRPLRACRRRAGRRRLRRLRARPPRPRPLRRAAGADRPVDDAVADVDMLVGLASDAPPGRAGVPARPQHGRA